MAASAASTMQRVADRGRVAQHLPLYICHGGQGYSPVQPALVALVQLIGDSVVVQLKLAIS